MGPFLNDFPKATPRALLRNTAPAMAWRVVDAEHTLRRAVSLGATEYTGDDKSLNVPAVLGIGESLLYFVDTYGDESCYSATLISRAGRLA